MMTDEFVLKNVKPVNRLVLVYDPPSKSSDEDRGNATSPKLEIFLPEDYEPHRETGRYKYMEFVKSQTNSWLERGDMVLVDTTQLITLSESCSLVLENHIMAYTSLEDWQEQE